jgi:hypothetical protein
MIELTTNQKGIVAETAIIHEAVHRAREYEFAARLTRHGPIAQLGERKSGRLEAAGSSPAGSIA